MSLHTYRPAKRHGRRGPPMEERRLAEAAGVEVARLVAEGDLRPEEAGEAVRFVQAAWTGQVLTGWQVRGERLTVGERYVWERLFKWMQYETAKEKGRRNAPGAVAEGEEDKAAALARLAPFGRALKGSPSADPDEGRRRRDERTRAFWGMLLEEVFAELGSAFLEEEAPEIPRIRRLLFGEEDRAGWNWNELKKAGIDVPRPALAWAYDVLAGATRLDRDEYEDGGEFDLYRREELDDALAGVREARRAWYSSEARRTAKRERTRSRSRRTGAGKANETEVGHWVKLEVPMREIARRLGVSLGTVARIYKKLHEEKPDEYPAIEERKKESRHDHVHGRERVRPGTIQIIQSKRTRSMDPGTLDRVRDKPSATKPQPRGAEEEIFDE